MNETNGEGSKSSPAQKLYKIQVWPHCSKKICLLINKIHNVSSKKDVSHYWKKQGNTLMFEKLRILNNFGIAEECHNFYWTKF